MYTIQSKSVPFSISYFTYVPMHYYTQTHNYNHTFYKHIILPKSIFAILTLAFIPWRVCAILSIMTYIIHSGVRLWCCMIAKWCLCYTNGTMLHIWLFSLILMRFTHTLFTLQLLANYTSPNRSQYLHVVWNDNELIYNIWSLKTVSQQFASI